MLKMASRTRVRAVLLLLLLALCSVCAAGQDDDFDFRRHTCGSKNCYDILGVKADASMASIRKTYRDLSQKFHPDKFDKTKISAKEAKEKFQEIARAYEILSDGDARKNYDVIISDPSIWIKLRALERGNKAIKTNWFLVAPIVLGLVIFFEWYITSTNYQQAVKQYRARMRGKKKMGGDSSTPPSSPRQKKKMERKATKTKLANENANSTADGDESSGEDFVIIGSDGKRVLPYSFKRSIIVETIKVPYDVAIDVNWAVNWFIKYKILKKPYDDAAKDYLTMSSLLLSSDAWELMSDEEKQDLISKELWVEDNLLEYGRSNKGGNHRSKSMPLPKSTEVTNAR